MLLTTSLHGFFKLVIRYMGVDLCRRNVAVTEGFLNKKEITGLAKQGCCECVAQGVQYDRCGNAGAFEHRGSRVASL